MGQLYNYIRITGPQPEVGMGATVIHWTDRSPATITRVSKSGKIIWIRMDNFKRTDKNGMSEMQTYRYTRGDGPEIRVTLCKDGQWRRKGEKVGIGRREKYHDFSF